MTGSVAFRVNNKAVQLTVERHRTLSWVLRTDLGLTGTKFGCVRGVHGYAQRRGSPILSGFGR